MSPIGASSLSRAAAEDFLYQEAALLDAWQLDEWLKLFTTASPLIYWIPGADGEDPDKRTSIVYDDRHRLEERVWRLVEGPAHAQIPRSVTTRIIGNVDVAVANGALTLVRSTFLLHEVRKRQERSFAGRYEHSLALEEGEWRIAQRKAILANSDLPIFNLSFIL